MFIIICAETSWCTMFFYLKRDLPEVERKILDSLGPRDLVNAKQVCRHWATSVRRYIQQLDADKTSDLMKRAFRERHSFYAVVTITQTFHDLTVNDRKEMYILSDDKIMQFDTDKLHVTKTKMFERNIWFEKEEDYLTRGIHFRIHANDDGSQFLVKNPLHNAVQCWKYMQSTDLLVYSGDSKKRMKYNSDVVGTKIVPQRKKISRKDLLKIKTCLNANDIVQLGCGLIMFTQQSTSPLIAKSITLISVAYMCQPFYAKNIAMVQMNPKYSKLRVVGTRVFCYESGIPLHTKCPENAPENYTPRPEIAVFDIWNPASVESDSLFTEIKKSETCWLFKYGSSAEMKQLISKLNY